MGMDPGLTLVRELEGGDEGTIDVKEVPAGSLSSQVTGIELSKLANLSRPP